MKTNHEDVIMSPVSGCHNGPWLAGYGLAFIRRADEPLENEKSQLRQRLQGVSVDQNVIFKSKFHQK